MLVRTENWLNLKRMKVYSNFRIQLNLAMAVVGNRMVKKSFIK